MTIVVSAVNLRKGGTLTILRDCLQALSEWQRGHRCRVVALVHSRELAPCDGIEYVELPWSVRSWLHRLWCEYVTMHRLSRQIGDVDLWLSLHDTTPRVQARRQAVYCHNSYPFFRWRWRHVVQNYHIVCFALFTKWIYRINIHRNDYLIVQQEWFRQAMMQMFGIDKRRVIVSRPSVAASPEVQQAPSRCPSLGSRPVQFLYPAYPDVHKNLECLCEAARLLELEVGEGRFEVLLTTDRDANKYTRWIHRRWGSVKSVRFCGFMSRELLFEHYAQADCLVFSSKVETWGLPISEFTETGKPMLLADLPYAHETAAGSNASAFFDPDNPQALKELMHRVVEGDLTAFAPQPRCDCAPPVAPDWPSLIRMLLNQDT